MPMSNKKDFFSDIFGLNPDVRQTLSYNNVKAYPSVNSGNDGHVHSEENVRWLTKQFVRKPFIIQYDDNDMEEFKYEGSSLNAGTTTGGMVNIDGYIINSASDLNSLSFDNTKNTMLGTGSDYGYIEHQNLQKVSEKFTKGLEQFDLLAYLYPEPAERGEIHEYFRSSNVWNSILPNLPSTTSTHKCQWDFIRLSLSYAHKKELNEPYETNVFKVNIINPETGILQTKEIPLDLNISKIGNSKIPTAICPSSVVITYDDVDVVNYILNDVLEGSDINSLPDKYPKFVKSVKLVEEPVKTISVEYNCYYGILTDKLKSIKDSKGDYTSTLFIQDIFGIYFVYKPDLSINTHTYPFTQNPNINFIKDEITPGLDDDTVNIIRGCNNIYDTSDLYEVVKPSEDEDDGYDLLSRHIESAKDQLEYPYNINDFYARNVEKVPGEKALTDILNSSHFRVVNESSIINTFKQYCPDDQLSIQLSTGALSSLCNNYYCLNLTSDSIIMKSFGLKLGSDYVPVGFLTSSGDLQVMNFQRLYKNTEPNKYHSKYIDSEGDTYYQQVYIESYVAFFRRMCSKLYNIDISRTSKYGNITRLDEHNNPGWAQIFKDIQYGRLKINPTQDIVDNMSEILKFFGVTTNSELTFEVMYNKLIAPYMNFYIQLGWSSLVDNALSSKGSFIARYGLSEIRNAASQYPVISRSATGVTYGLNRRFSSEGLEVQKAVFYENNTYSDYDRLNNFLYVNKSTQQLTDNLYYKTKLDWGSGENSKCWCQDYISYIKGCSRQEWTDTNSRKNPERNISNDKSYVQIAYKLTTLSSDSSGDYDNFATYNHIVDRFAYYTKGENNTTKCSVVPGYVQNVRIATDSLIPVDSLDINTYNWFDSVDIKKDDIDTIKSPMNNATYNLTMETRTNISCYGSQIRGVGGFYFTGSSQGWAMSIPTMFKLYKDGQNYLEGRYRGTTNHAGIFVDYKLPMNIEDKDFWFANTWLTPVRTVVSFDIENNGTQYPTSTTDGMTQYLKLRNHTLFSTDVIYNIDKDGNYLSLEDFIQNSINQSSVNISDYLDAQPILNYIDFVSDENSDVKETCELVSYNGLRSNITRLKQLAEELCWNVGWVQSGNNASVIIENNKYYDITTSLNTLSVIGRVQVSDPSENPNSGNLNKYNINTVLENDNKSTFTSTNNIIRTTIKTKFKKDNFTLELNTVLNGFTDQYAESGYGIPVMWDSNYPVTIGTKSDGTAVYTINIKDLTTTESDSQCLIELDIHLNSDKTSAIGHCNISIIANPNTLTFMDMNYLWKELYKLDCITWGQVSAITKGGFAKHFWKIGDTKTFEVRDGDKVYEIPAILIGIDSENPNSYNSTQNGHTLTWLTNIYNNPETNIEDSTILNKKFSPAISGNLGKYGYNGATLGNFLLPVMQWLNDTVVTNMEKDLSRIITPCRKTNGQVYSCSDADNYRLLQNSSSGTKITNKTESLLWLPSLSELGLSFTVDDPIEKSFVDSGKNPRSAFKIGNYYVNECSDGTDTDITYPYFQLPQTQQNVKSLTLLTNSYYVTNKDLSTISPQPDLNSYEYKLEDFDTVDRVLYTVGTSFNKNGSSARFLTILPKEDVESVLGNQVYTDFCFITT